MGRRLLVVSLFLVLGAIATVAVSWLCAIQLDENDGALEPAWRSGSSRVTQRLLRAGTELYSTSLRGPVDAAILASMADAVPGWAIPARVQPPDTSHVRRVGRGWPMIALWSEERVIRGVEAEVVGGLVTALPPHDVDLRNAVVTVAHALPLRPAWPGFVGDTLFYAVVFWLLLTPLWIVRRLRRRRRACPGCGYPAGRAAVCTECGGDLGWLRTRPRSTAQRRLVVSLRLLGLGLAVNVAVAWVGALVVDVQQREARESREFDGRSVRHVTRRDARGVTWIESRHARRNREPGVVGHAPGEIVPGWLAGRLGPPEAFAREISFFEIRGVDARGWPLRSLWSSPIGASYGMDRAIVHRVRGGIDFRLPPWIEDRRRIPRVLPLRPIWSGLLVNSLLYAAILGIVLLPWRDRDRPASACLPG